MVAVSPVVVGRAAEIAVLGESWALARGGSPATVLIGGEAGIGKTRLVGHFTADVEAEVLYGGCVDLSGSGLPFAPFTAALRGHADTPAELLPGDVQADSDTARARLFEEMLTRLAGLCARRPVVLVIEDIHWIDRSSLDLLSFLVHNQQAAGALLCVVTYRSDELERAHPLRRSLAELDRVAWTRRMELPRLTRRAVGSLVGAIGGAEPAASLVAEIYRRSEGNPFFAEVLLDSYGCGTTPAVTAGQIIDGFRALIDAAHARGIRVIGATILPFKADYEHPADFQRAEAIRQAVNNWILGSGEYDAVADFATAVADPADPQQLNPSYDSGDHLHPNDVGYRAIAAAIDIDNL